MKPQLGRLLSSFPRGQYGSGLSSATAGPKGPITDALIALPLFLCSNVPF